MAGESTVGGAVTVEGGPSAIPKSLRWAATSAWALVILGICWWPRRQLPVDESGLIDRWNFDKAIHFGLFAIQGGLAAWARIFGGRFAWIALAGIALAIVSELGQAMSFVGREPGVSDTLADVAGLFAGMAAVALIPRLRRG